MDIQREIQQFLEQAYTTTSVYRTGSEGNWVWDSGSDAIFHLLDRIYPMWRDYLDEVSPPPPKGYDLVLDYSFRTKRMTAKCSVHGQLPVIKHADDRMQYDITILDAWLHMRNHHGHTGLPEFDVLSDGDRWHDAISYAMGQPIGTVTTLQSDSQ